VERTPTDAGSNKVRVGEEEVEEEEEEEEKVGYEKLRPLAFLLRQSHPGT